jgi:formylglycine-generating enzyme required for sulfatase activity
MGCTTTEDPNCNEYSDGEEPEHIVTLASFALDEFEVTVGRFRKFVNAFSGPPATGAGADPNVASSGWGNAGDTGWSSLAANSTALTSSSTGVASCGTYGTWTASVGSNEDAAMNCVDWYEAFAFCAWDGGWLPTEAEWEYVARATDHRIYPWGTTDPSTTPMANDGYSGSGDSPFIAVGSYPHGNGPFGHSDLAGGMWEWVMDWYSGTYYNQWATANSCNECANISSGSYRVFRGGGWDGTTDSLRAASRSYDSYSPTARDSNIGFRCARTP